MHDLREQLPNEISNSPLDTKTLDELLADVREPPPEIVEGGVLLRQSLLLLYGKPKVGKTFLALNFAIAISQGRSFAGFIVTNPERVLVLSSEGGYFPTRARVRQMCGELGMMHGQNLRIATATRIRLDTSEGVRLLDDELTKFKPSVLLLDPLARFHAAEENSANEMSDLFRTLHYFIKKYDLSIILVHHSGKGEGSTSRGSSVIHGEHDSAIHLKMKGEQRHELEFEMRHVETLPKCDLKFNSNTFWFESTHRNLFSRIIAENGRAMEKGSLAAALVRHGKFAQVKSAYKGIDRAVKRGELIQKQKLYYSA